MSPSSPTTREQATTGAQAAAGAAVAGATTTSAPSTRRGSDGAPSRAELLDAALAEFADLGYDGTSVRRLARRLGVHHNHFPQRFGTKERLWYAAVDQGFAELARDMLPVLSAETPDRVAHLRALLVCFVEATSAHPAILRIINREAALGGPRFDYVFDTYIGPVFDDVRSLLDRLAHRGLVRPDAATVVLFFSLNGAGGGPASFPHLTHRIGADLDPDDPNALRRHAERAVGLLFDGLLVR